MDFSSSLYLVPYVDLSTEIIPQGSDYEAIGQVRTVLPGETGCLICSGAIDSTQAALDLLTEEQQKKRTRRGYIRSSDDTPAAAVLDLNGVTSDLGMSQVRRLVFGEGLRGREFLHYDREKCLIVSARTEPRKDCPVCGPNGYLGAGDEEVPEEESQTSPGRTYCLFQGVRTYEVPVSNEALKRCSGGDGQEEQEQPRR